jgi:prevent-host-death family protein
MTTISAKELRTHLGDVVSKVRHGGRFTVLYRSRPAFDIVPVGESTIREGPPDEDSLYRAGPVGSSVSGDVARNHDEELYG